jgi:hypothetical protein
MSFPAQGEWRYADRTLRKELSWIGACLQLITAGTGDGLAVAALQFLL